MSVCLIIFDGLRILDSCEMITINYYILKLIEFDNSLTRFTYLKYNVFHFIGSSQRVEINNK